MSWNHLSKYRGEIMGFACLWVMLHHNSFDWQPSLDILRRIANYGNLGVDMFLLVSGIGLYYAWQKKPKLGTFYARRLVRVLVPYAFLAIPYWIWRDLHLGKGSFWLDVTQLSLPLQGVITTWYIPAIVCFYLLYPLIAKYLFSGDCKTRAVWLCGALIIGCIGLVGNEYYENCEIALTRSVIFIVGCCLGKSVYEKEPVSNHAVALSAVWLVINWFLRKHVSMPAVYIRFSYVPLCLALCLVLAWVFDRLSGWNWLRSVLRFFGDRSLELYLTHVLIRNVVYNYIPVRQWDPWGILTYGLILLISLIVSVLLHPLFGRLCSLRRS